MTEHRRPDLDRRAFVRLGVAGGAASLVAACGWDGGNALRPRLLDISRLNDWVGEKILFSPTRLARTYTRSEEHTSELQSQSNLVCRLLLEKKKKKTETSYVSDGHSDKTTTRL